ncbi:MAG: molybdopterin-dependent oxidoreductase [Chthoniobacterales bacterium]
MSRPKAILGGLFAGLLAAIGMLLMMLVLASLGVATPLAILGDRLSVFFTPGPFLALMGRVGGYNHLKQLGVGSTAAGILAVGTIGGVVLALFNRRERTRLSTVMTVILFILLPIVAVAITLWPVLGTHYRGLPINAARLVTLIGFALCTLVYERILVGTWRWLVKPKRAATDAEFSPSVGRRAVVLGGLGLILVGGGAALVRKLYRAASFSYDGTQYKGPDVQPITPNDQFYCVTKNVIDPRVDPALWHLEVDGLVRTPRAYRLEEVKAFSPTEQETTLMCISNGLDGGLMSNARWKGVSMRDLIAQSSALSSATKVRLHGVDNYTDTFPVEKALDPTTLVVYEMNGEPLPHRHGFPARVIVPGYYGEKHVKWLTRIELTGPEAKGFYEKQGWGPDFMVPTRSRIDVPFDQAVISLGQFVGPVEVKGVAYGGDRGISRVEVSFDDGQQWSDAEIYYSGGDLGWSLWRARGGWKPQAPGNYVMIARATDGEGEVQEFDPDRPFSSGATGFHKITVYITA